jgi:predicted ribosome-associated RNA-binding protein Tma20
LTADYCSDTQYSIVIKSKEHYQTLKNVMQYDYSDTDVKITISHGAKLCVIKGSDVFSHNLTVSKDTGNGRCYHNVLVIGDKKINNMSNSEIDSLIAKLQKTAMEDFNS